MRMNQAVCLPLLLVLPVLSGVAGSPCVLINADTRCVCSTQVLSNIQDVAFCISAVELELRDGRLESLSLDSSYLPHLQYLSVHKIIFTNVSMSFNFLISLSPILQVTKVNEISIASSSILAGTKPVTIPYSLIDSKITNLYLEDVTVDSSLLQPSLKSFHLWLFRSLESFSLIRSGLANIECYWVEMVRNLIRLDVSEDPLSWSSLYNISRCSSPSFSRLDSLGLRSTNLTSLQPICVLLGLTPVLTKLDVSRNRFTVLEFPRCLQEVESLRMLNLSHSGITETEASLLKSLTVLDFSYNSLESFRSPSQSLEKLYLSNNRLTSLPSLSNLSQLKVLEVDGNQLTFLLNKAEGGVSQDELERLGSLRAGSNPYHCDSTMKDTIYFLESSASASVQDWPEAFVCATPEDMKGTHIAALSYEELLSRTQRPEFTLCFMLCWFIIMSALF